MARDLRLHALGLDARAAAARAAADALDGHKADGAPELELEGAA